MAKHTSAQGVVHPFVIYVICSIAGIMLGIFLSQSYVNSLTHGSAVKWVKMTDLPSLPTGLLEADLYRIFVQTEQGIYLSAGMEQCLEPGGEACWSLVDEVDPGRLYLSPCSSHPFFETPSPPTNYSQSLIIQECGPDSFNEIHYIFGENGEIWFWRHGSYAPGTVNVMILAGCIGASLGLFAGLFLANRFISAVRTPLREAPLRGSPGETCTRAKRVVGVGSQASR
jgi:uncharacterized protein YneF (UPF0154 family)